MRKDERATTDNLNDLPDHFLRCRSYGHSWEQIPITLANPEYVKLFHWYDVLRCVICGTERYDGINELGQVGNRSYNYPHGYPLSFTLSRSEARREMMFRTRGLLKSKSRR